MYNKIFLIYEYVSVMDLFNTLLKDNSINDIISFSVHIIDILNPIKGSPNLKYDNRYFLTCIIDFLSNHTSWRKYTGTIECPIDGRYLNGIHNKYVKLHDV